METKITSKDLNLFKATLQEGREKEFNLDPEIVNDVTYEFYKFFSVFKEELYKNWAKDILKDMTLKNDEFPIYCIMAFTNSYSNYKDKTK